MSSEPHQAPLNLKSEGSQSQHTRTRGAKKKSSPKINIDRNLANVRRGHQITWPFQPYLKFKTYKTGLSSSNESPLAHAHKHSVSLLCLPVPVSVHVPDFEPGMCRISMAIEEGCFGKKGADHNHRRACSIKAKLPPLPEVTRNDCFNQC